jgi:glycosyltransferase involved in cell wall biosynthesis
VDDLTEAMAAQPHADVWNLTSFLPDSVLPVVYAAADGVLANSGHEPFGLVGLEVMGAGGLAFVGSTGEEYAEADRNAIVLDTDDPREIVVQLRRLLADRAEVRRLKRRGKETARAFVWPVVLRELFTKLEYVALTRDVEIGA